MRSKRLVPPGLTYLAENITTRHNILGAAPRQRARWAQDLGLRGEAETMFFSGCGYQYAADLEALTSLIRRLDRSPVGLDLPMRFANFQKKLGPDLAGIYRKVLSRDGSAEAAPLKDAVSVLRHLGIDFGYLGEREPCCGAPLYFAGMQQRFAENARQTSRRLKDAGARRIISIVPSCTQALRSLFPQCVPDFDLEVRHFLEVLDEGLGRLKLRFPREVKVVYHDPCQLTRYLGITEEPRRILRAIRGVQLLEPEWTGGVMATCCGGGGGFEAVFPELSGTLAANRVRELAATGADIIVTHCPGCILQLESGRKALGLDNIEVLDLVQVVARALEGGNDAA
ncbi:MAG: (Fe-S)-binding protein [Chloroflexota bacterium]